MFVLIIVKNSSFCIIIKKLRSLVHVVEEDDWKYQIRGSTHNNQSKEYLYAHR